MNVTTASSMNLPSLFQDALKSALTHRRNVAAAKKNAVNCIKGGRDAQLAYCESFKKCLFVLLNLKRGTPGVERVLKFVRSFLEMASDETDPNSVVLKPMSSFLVEYLLYHLSKGFHAKDKNVRFRVCQITGLLFEYLEEADDDLITTFLEQLYMRTFDKEATVRSHAVTALSVLMDSDDESGNQKNLNRLLDMLNFDSSSEVRKSALWNLPLNENTLSHLIKRSKDTDYNVRKSVYLRLSDSSFNMDLLQKEQRNEILKNGLFDRDQNVKKACLKFLCEKWVGNSDILDLLNTVDMDYSACTEAAIKSYFLSRPNVKIVYEETVWENLNPQTSFLLRIYIQYCTENKLLDDLENAMPNAIKLLELLQKHSKSALYAEEEEVRLSDEFVFGQLLMITEYQDYTDEMGRREMLSSIRSFMVSLDLQEELLESMVKTMKLTAKNDRDFVSIMVEILYDCYDAHHADEEEQQSDELEKAMVLLKCLDIIKCMLSQMDKNFADDATLSGILETFIVPAVGSNNTILSQQALNCLALAFLLDKSLARKKMPIFIHSFRSGNPEYQKIALKTMFDLVTFYGFPFFDHEESIVRSQEILEIFEQALESVDQEVLTLTVEGITKLFLFKYLENVEILQVLVISYFHPTTAQFIRLRQCLSYFFQVFAHSSYRNQLLLMECLLPAITFLAVDDDDKRDDAGQGSNLSILQQMVDWIDIRKLVGAQEDAHVSLLHEKFAVEAMMHVIENPGAPSARLIVQVLPSLILQSCPLNRRKVLVDLAEKIKLNINEQPLLNAMKRFNNLIELSEEEKKLLDREASRDIQELGNHQMQNEKEQSDIELTPVQTDVGEEELEKEDTQLTD